MKDIAMRKIIVIALAILIVLLFIWILWAVSMYKLSASSVFFTNIGEFGQWGDTFGPINALFGAFGFSIIAATLYLQHKQNEYNELEQHRQKFDATFFEILKLLREARNDVKYKFSSDYCNAMEIEQSKLIRGTDAFRAAWEEYVYWYCLKGTKISRVSAGIIYYNKIHRRYESNFGPYFRLLYNTMRRIDDDDILSEDQKTNYARLLRGQLNSYEVALVGLNGLTRVSKNLSYYIIKLRMLKYLPSRTRRRSILRRYYPKSCFTAQNTGNISSYIYGFPPRKK